MLKEAENEFTEIDLARASNTDPFAKDKVVKIESTAATKRTTESIRYGEELMFSLEIADTFK